MTLETKYAAALQTLNDVRDALMESPEFVQWISDVQEIIDDEDSEIELDEIDPDALVKVYLDNDSAEDSHGDLYNLWHD